ncbi:preprotein translocase subunit YajC [Ralstonia solanacearum]|uniref:Sec translocon accessory complex subunit YajC n=5 Tax=Ralstonia solanacearum species complex TaxID=3116862 RepID=A0A0K1ZPZ4_RALSL|nr:Preprotein translocase subunit YajC [Ralstonia pseudosolanacearum FQY_4]AKZ27912.1 preprotein translocase subunit YajC [Ralstonia solanacearum]AST29056.1 preprotein translocase subunit YajC [Ralstonia pseudosolanacearum]AVV68311.1 preprotein translocase subunit YajC [Ralstonia solanacearum OE1-1]ESS49197.1 protein translocase auxillary subunit [Ralstonia solanacearum SD54]QUP57663.1 preprotein translocase subunit YajC [Ralstonia nicotianae]
MLMISDAYAQTAGAAPGGAGNGLMSFLPIILMFVVLWFIMIRPQMKRQKETKTMLEALAKGDEVVTAGGILGKVTKVTDQYITVEVAPNTELTVQKNAVTTVLPKGTLKSL